MAIDFAGDSIGALPLGGRDAPARSELLALLAQPEWMRDGLCREPQYPRSLFFPGLGEDLTPAREICQRCLVAPECLAYALERGERGVWGGTSERERGAMRRGAA